MPDPQNKPFRIKDETDFVLKQTDEESRASLVSVDHGYSEADEGKLAPLSASPAQTDKEKTDNEKRGSRIDPPALSQERFNQWWQRGRQFAQSPQLKKALNSQYTPFIVMFVLFQLIFVVQLQNANAFLFLGRIFGDDAKDDGLFQEAHFLDPKNSDALYGSADFWFERRDFPRAAQSALAALKLDSGENGPADSQPPADLEKQSLFSLATRQHSTASNAAQAFFILGEIESANCVLGKSGASLEKAENYYRQSLAKNPTVAGANAGYAWTLYHQGKIAQAKEFYSKASKLQPSLAILEHQSGYNSLQNGRHYSPALSYIFEERARGLGVERFNKKGANYIDRTHFNQADAANSLGLAQAGRAHALYCITKAFQTDLIDEAYDHLIDADRLLADYKAVEKDLKDANRHANVPINKTALVEPLVFEGRYDQAIAYANEALAKPNSDDESWTLIYRAYAYAKSGKSKEAKADAKRAAAYDPFGVYEANQMMQLGLYKRAHDLLDLSLAISQDTTKAKQAIKELEKLEKTNPAPPSPEQQKAIGPLPGAS